MFLRYFSYLLLCFILIGGCKSKKNNNSELKLKKRSAKYLIEKLDKYHLDTEWLSTKGSIKLVQNNKTTKATAYIRMRKDSVIWAAVRKLGVEAGRVLITQDSVFLVNRLEKTYYAKSVDYIQNMMGFSGTGNRQKDFRNLSQIILGNPVFLEDTDYKVDIKSPYYKLTKNLDGIDTEYWIQGKNYSLYKMMFQQDSANKRASCIQEDYQPLGNELLFSYIRKLNLYSTDTGSLNIDLNFKTVSLNKPVSIKFEIPSSYAKVD